MSARWVAAVLFLAAAGAQQQRDLRVESVARPNPLGDLGARWAVVVGISQYQHLPPGAQLHFAHRDAEEFASFLMSQTGGLLAPDHIRLLANERATLAELRAALHTWLVSSAGPQDVVYFYFAGHGVLDNTDQGYFVAYDSDPQNLHATALPFEEVDAVLSNKVRAGLVVMIADACHTGRLGWSTYQESAVSRASEPLAQIGRGDRSFLKLLGSRPSESSFEDPDLDGGHGVMTYSLLQGLNGAADQDGDHVVRASEAVDYVSRRVAELTARRQHPRVAGTFDARVALAALEGALPATLTTLDVTGPARSAIYIDNAFRGALRPAGALRVDGLAPGVHLFSADFPGGATLNGTVTLSERPANVNIAPPPPSALMQLRERMQRGQILDPGGAWDFYRTQMFPAVDRAAATASIGAALEEIGQACVSDYVQSTATGLKRAMLGRAVDAFERLQTLRPNDASMETRKTFCRGRLLIAENRFAEAVTVLQDTLRRDVNFACAYNALGVALGRVGRAKESRAAFEMAAKLTPEWGLPPFQIAAQLMAGGNARAAVPYLRKAVAFNPRSVTNRWNLVHALRLAGDVRNAEREAAELVRMEPNYAPAYLELGQVHETQGNAAKAADAYETYVLLAPNYADTAEVRAKVARLRR